jgi:hypothetical protein
MATKAGRAEVSDVRAGKTLWYAAIDHATGKRYPLPTLVGTWARKLISQRELPAGSDAPEAFWVFYEYRRGKLSGRLIYIKNFPLNHKEEPSFDKCFVSRSAVLRWIKRYESNRVETLCEDRRVFKYGSHFMRRSGIDVINLADNQFVMTEQWLVNEAKYERHPKQPFNLFEAAQAAQEALAEALPS